MTINEKSISSIKKLINLLGLLALASVLWLYIKSSAPYDAFSSCGLLALSFLLLCLCVTPASKILKAPNLIKLRRLPGLWAFFWALAHAGIYLSLIMRFNLETLLKTTKANPFIIPGQLAFVILLILALSSGPKAMRFLGANWRRLHRLVYLALILAITHFWMLAPSEPDPKFVAAFGLFLLLFRLKSKLAKK